MKIVKSVILASALCVSAFSLSGCSTTGQAQPQTSSGVPSVVDAKSPGAEPSTTEPTFATSTDYWKSRIGQRCRIDFSGRGEGYTSVEGFLKSADDSWTVVGQVHQFRGVGGKEVDFESEYAVPTSNVTSVEFSHPYK